MQVRIAHELWREFDTKICSLFAHLGNLLLSSTKAIQYTLHCTVVSAPVHRNGTNVQDNFVAYVGPLTIVCEHVRVSKGIFSAPKTPFYD